MKSHLKIRITHLNPNLIP